MFRNVTLIESRSPAPLTRVNGQAPLAWTSPGNPIIKIAAAAPAKQRLFDGWQRVKHKPKSEGCIVCLVITNKRLTEPSINRGARPDGQP